MAETKGDKYEVVVWGFDSASDAGDDLSDDGAKAFILPYYCAKRVDFSNLVEAKIFAENQFEKSYVGAAVFLAGKILFGVGLVFDYQEKYC